MYDRLSRHTCAANVANAQAGSGWFLWHHTYATRAPKDVKPANYVRYVIQNDWGILNAVETRDQCRALLREEFSKKREWMVKQMVGSEGTAKPVLWPMALMPLFGLAETSSSARQAQTCASACSKTFGIYRRLSILGTFG